MREIGLTPRRFRPDEYAELPRHGIGLTDPCKARAGNDDELGERPFDVGRLNAEMETYQPQVLAFNGKRAAKEAFGLRSTGQVAYGDHGGTIGGVPTCVQPSTSGSARKHWSIEPWRELAKTIAKGEL